MAWDLIKQEIGIFKAGENMTSARGKAVTFNSLDRWQISGLTGPLARSVHGILTNSPDNGRVASVQVSGVASVKLGGTVTAGRYLDIDANGDLIESHPGGSVGIALDNGIAGDIIPVLLLLSNTVDVSVNNPNECIYIKGDENTDGSVRICSTEADPTSHIELRTNGVWNDTSFRFVSTSTSSARFEQRGSINPSNLGSTMLEDGMYDGEYFDATSSSGIDVDGRFFQQNTGSVNGDFAITDLLTFYHRRAFNSDVIFKFKLEQLTDVRFYVALIDNLSFSTLVGSNDPTAEFTGLRFSTSAGDINFQFVSKDGTTQSVVDSGVAAATTAFSLQVLYDNSVPNATVTLYDSSGIKLASHTFTTNLPASTTDLGAGCGIQTLAASVKSIKQYGWTGSNPF